MPLNVVKWIKSFISPSKKFAIRPTQKPEIFECALSKTHISSNALKVISRLKGHGFQAYLIGGCVRDTLLGHRPKDFDVATNARPDQIRSLFSNCRIIGKRFLLAHILFQQEIIEVATFRACSSTNKEAKILAHDNTFGTIEQDVLRRDFTLNALYYNPVDQQIVDLVGGIKDLDNRVLRVIGNPATRFQEDPVRMIRAVRYAAKLSLSLDTELKEALLKKGSLILHVPKARLLEEFYKCFLQERALDIFKLMHHMKIARYVVPREVLKTSLVKKIGKSCSWIASQGLLRDQYMILLFATFFFAFRSVNSQNTRTKTLSDFFDKFQKVILVPKQFEQNFKKIIHTYSSQSKPRSSLKHHVDLLKLLPQLERNFS